MLSVQDFRGGESEGVGRKMGKVKGGVFFKNFCWGNVFSDRLTD